MRLIYILYFIFLFPGNALPQSSIQKLPARHFTTANGLTQNSAHDAVFDKNGYLWISIRTDNVFLYDGYRFTPCWYYKNGKRFAFKSANLFCNSAGDIFIAHENGIHIRKKNTDSFVQASQAVLNGENEGIIFIGEGSQHEIYFFNQGEIYALHQSANGAYTTDSIITTGNAAIYFERSVDGVARKSFFWFSKFGETDFYLFSIDKKKIIKKVSQPKSQNIA